MRNWDLGWSRRYGSRANEGSWYSLFYFLNGIIVSHALFNIYYGPFAGFYELDRATFNGQIYRLVLNEDLDIHYTYGLCHCKGFGERCQCDHFFSTKTPHNRNIPTLGVDLGLNILQVKFDQELWYEYDGETATCYEIIQLTGTCLNNQ